MTGFLLGMLAGFLLGAAVTLLVCRETRRIPHATVTIAEPTTGMVLFRMSTDEIDRIVAVTGPTSDTTIVPVRLELSGARQ